MTIFDRLGRALKFLRERQGRSQKEVAAAAGVTAPMLSAYENERSKPEIETLDRILRQGLDVTLEELWWALDVVNDRVPAASWLKRGTGQRAEEPRGVDLAAPRPGETGRSELEDGCEQIARGLLRLSRALVDSIHQATSRREG